MKRTKRNIHYIKIMLEFPHPISNRKMTDKFHSVINFPVKLRILLIIG